MTTDAAGEVPVERQVRPWGTRLDLDAQPVGYDRRQGDILRWREPQVGPLYDQAALDAAVAAGREEAQAQVLRAMADLRRQAAEIERLRAGHDRYEVVRRMNVDAFRDACVLNRRTGKPFDEIVADLAPFFGLTVRA